MATSSSSFSWPPFEIKVTRRAPELIPPSSPTPREVKLLSDIDDQGTLRFHLPFILFYPKNSSHENKRDPVSTIRRGLAEALVPYYPLAGRVREGTGGKLSVDCTGEGILFVEAEADVTLEQLGEWIRMPCPWLDDLLYNVPGSSSTVVGSPLLLVQATRLNCGGLVVAVRLNHTVTDGLGLAHFLNRAAEVSRGEACPPPPTLVWRREMFMARDPPLVTCIHHEYEDVPHSSYSSAVATDRDNMVQASFFFGPKELAALRKQLPQKLSSESSSFDVITACIWRCRTAALQLDHHEVVRLTCTVNVRTIPGFELPPGFYGNAFGFPTVLSQAGRLCSSPFGYALELVKAAKAKMSKEYIQSAADFLATNGRPGCTTVWNLAVSDASRAGLDRIDFGWGKPVYGGPAAAVPLLSPYGRYKNTKGEIGIIVPLWLPPNVMFRLRKELIKMTQLEPPMDEQSRPGAVVSSKL